MISKTLTDILNSMHDTVKMVMLVLGFCSWPASASTKCFDIGICIGPWSYLEGAASSDHHNVSSPEQLAPEALSGVQKVTTLSRVPAMDPAYRVWNSVVSDRQQTVFLEIPKIKSAYQVYLNGRKVGAVGRLGSKLQEEVAVRKALTLPINLKEGANSLYFTISNESFAGSKYITRSEVVFSAEDQSIRAYILDSFMIGAIFLIGIYHLYLWLLGRNFKAKLYFALAAIIFCLRTLLTSEANLFEAMFGSELEALLAAKLEYLTLAFVVLLFFLFVKHSFPSKVNTSLIATSNILALLYALIVISTKSLVSAPAIAESLAGDESQHFVILNKRANALLGR